MNGFSCCERRDDQCLLGALHLFDLASSSTIRSRRATGSPTASATSDGRILVWLFSHCGTPELSKFHGSDGAASAPRLSIHLCRWGLAFTRLSRDVTPIASWRAMVQTVRQRDVGLVRLARDGSCQITEAFPWYEALRYLIRDRDCVYGASVTRRMRTMGIRDKPIAPGRAGRGLFRYGSGLEAAGRQAGGLNGACPPARGGRT